MKKISLAKALEPFKAWFIVAALLESYLWCEKKLDTEEHVAGSFHGEMDDPPGPGRVHSGMASRKGG